MRHTRSVLAVIVAAAVGLAPDPAAAASPTVSSGSMIRASDVSETAIVRDGMTLSHRRTTVPATPVTGKGRTTTDFDGDGRDDLAVQGYKGVFVTYSSAPYRDVLTTDFPAGGNLGRRMVGGNFNGDRYDDLAVSDSSEADLKNMGYRAGAVWIFPGGPGGLQVDAARHLTQSTSGVPGASAELDQFGESLAAGDITGDGRDELAIGIPFKTVAGRRQAGAVVVLKGSPNGIVTTGAQYLAQSTSGVPSNPENWDLFGFTLAIGRIDRNRYQELIVGVPQEDYLQATEGTGMITQFWGGSAGVSLRKVTAVTGRQVTRAAPQDNQYFWSLGSNLAVGDTNGDGYGEVIDGTYGAQAGHAVEPGAVVSLAGRSTGLSAKGVIVLTQNSKGVAGAAESEDRFGAAIAVGDVTGDGRADVLAGVPGEDLGSARDCGGVVLLRGSAKGLTGVGSQTISQASPGVPDNPERGDAFGVTVALLNLNGSGGLDGLVGSPDEEVPGDPRGYASGTVTRFVGGAKGLNAVGLVSGRSVDPQVSAYGWYLAR
ncbi:FG-GAP repeat protein [Krasilnikovia sp. M28-CT-15]|uniref:FG-GAP repeat protein n=1 Tax=Krasilnikovia sp. M28-CT-15 TaxID=3373540 RepID=UPI0038761AD1